MVKKKKIGSSRTGGPSGLLRPSGDQPKWAVEKSETPRQEWYPQAKWRPCGLCVDARVCRKSSGDQVESRRQPIVRGEATRCPRGVPPLPVMAREIVRSFGGQLARKRRARRSQRLWVGRERTFFGKICGWSARLTSLTCTPSHFTSLTCGSDLRRRRTPSVVSSWGVVLRFTFYSGVR